MKAAILGEAGVDIRDIEKPEPKAGEIVIKVRAASLNRADLLIALGHRHGAQGGVGARLGLECAGEVAAVGSEVKDFKAGDRVMSSAPGAYAEFVAADCGPRASHPGQQHELRAGRLLSGGAADHAQRHCRRPAASRAARRC